MLAAACSQPGSGRFRVMEYGEQNKTCDGTHPLPNVAHICISPMRDVARDAEDEGHQHADISIADAAGHSCGVWGASKAQQSDMPRWHHCLAFMPSPYLSPIETNSKFCSILAALAVKQESVWTANV